MAKETINQLIDRVVGSSGLLRVPAWWMRRVLTRMVQEYTRGIAGVKSSLAGVKRQTEESVKALNSSMSGINNRLGYLEYNQNALNTNLNNKITTVTNAAAAAQKTADKAEAFLPSVKVTATGSTSVEIDGSRVSIASGTTELPYTKGFKIANTTYVSKIDLSNAWVINSDLILAFSYCSFVQKIAFDKPVNSRRVTSCRSMFYGTARLTEIDMSGFDSSNVTDMESMFQGTRVTELDLSMLDTSKVTTMNSMFKYSEKLTSLNLSGWDTRNVETLDSFVSGCKKLTSLDVSHFNTSKVTGMQNTFGWTPIETLDLSGWDTSNVTTMWCMFIGCNWLKSIDFSGWDTTKVTDFDCFISASGDHTPELESVDMRSFNTPSVINFNYMFGARTTLKGIKFGILDFASATDAGNMFHACNALTTFTGEVRNLKLSLDLGSSPLTAESAMVFINGLAEVETAQTLRLKSTTYEQLTPEQIAVATAKGWTVVSV